MRRMSRVSAVLAVLVLVFTAFVRADVKLDDKTQMKFHGALGKVFGLFGGKMMKEGITSTVAVRGDRKMTVTDNTAQIIDLKEEKVYDLDLKKKTYKVTTFDEIRRQLQEAQAKAENEAAKQRAKDKDKDAPEMEVDFRLAESGQSKTINGYNCREVVMTVAVHEKGKTLEQSGGLLLTTNNWLTADAKAAKEVFEFDKRYTEKLAFGSVPGDAAAAMAQALAMYPGLKDAMARMEAENVNMDGTPILITMAIEAVPTKEQMAQQQKQEESESSSGGLLGGFAKRLGRKKSDDQASAGAAPKPNTILTMNHEILKVSDSVTDADLTIPAGFKQKD